MERNIRPREVSVDVLTMEKDGLLRLKLLPFLAGKSRSKTWQLDVYVLIENIQMVSFCN